MGYGGGRRYGYNRYIRKVFYGAVCPDRNKRSSSESRSGFDSESSNSSGIGCLVLLILAVLIPAFLRGCA